MADSLSVDVSASCDAPAEHRPRHLVRANCGEQCMSYRVRRAVPADAPELARFLAGAGARRRADEPQRLATSLAQDAVLRCWVVEWGHDLVAILSVFVEGSPGKPRWLIESIHVDATHRKHGVTRLLLGAVRDEARQHKVRQLKTLCSPKQCRDGECLFMGRLY